MVSDVLAYVGAGMIVFWGIAHFFPTGSVVRGFGPVSEDNRRIITMEWIIEGLTLCFVGLLVLLVTIMVGPHETASIIVHRASAIMLLAMAVVSLLTGARTRLLPMKLCPPIFTIAAILLLLGSAL